MTLFLDTGGSMRLGQTRSWRLAYRHVLAVVCLCVHATVANAIEFSGSGGRAFGVQSFFATGLNTLVEDTPSLVYSSAQGSLDVTQSPPLLTLGGFNFQSADSTLPLQVWQSKFHKPGTINEFIPITLRIEGTIFSAETFSPPDSAPVECMPRGRPTDIDCAVLPGEALTGAMKLSADPHMTWTLSSPNMSVSGEAYLGEIDNVVTADLEGISWTGYPSGYVAAGGGRIQRNFTVWDSEVQGDFDGFDLYVTAQWSVTPFIAFMQSELMPPGDVDTNAVINIEDLNLVRNYFGTENPFPGQGDTNADGVVNITDLNNVRNNFGYDAVSNPAPPASVPEPAAWALLAIGAAGVLGLGRRSTRRRTHHVTASPSMRIVN